MGISVFNSAFANNRTQAALTFQAQIPMEHPTQPMKKEAASARFYKSPWGNHRRLQIFTIEELLNGKRIDYPPSQQVNVTFKKAPKTNKEKPQQLKL